MTQDREVEVVEEYPPNYQDVILFLGDVSPYKPIFAYDDKIYNPFGREVTRDVVYHELVHLDQQAKMGVDNWYQKYFQDRQFRATMETEAYSLQYHYAKENINAEADRLHREGKSIKNLKEMMDAFLDSLAFELSGSAYGNLMNFHKAKTAIRKYMVE